MPYPMSLSRPWMRWKEPGNCSWKWIFRPCHNPGRSGNGSDLDGGGFDRGARPYGHANSLTHAGSQRDADSHDDPYLVENHPR